MIKTEHDIHLLERTKLIEGILCQSITFTNALERNYTNGAVGILAGNFSRSRPVSYTATNLTDTRIKSKINGLYKNPLAKNEPINAPTPYYIANSITDGWDFGIAPSVSISVGSMTVTGGSLSQSADFNSISGGNTNDFVELTPTGNDINITYSLTLDSQGTDPAYREDISFTYALQSIENKLPLKPYTITDCICRCLELCKPLKKGELPQYALQGVTYSLDENGIPTRHIAEGSQAEKYDKIIAPNFSMTQCTLREQLKIIGGYIHAEPRLGYILEDGTYYENTICFDEYEQETEAPIANMNGCVYRSLSQSINDYCTNVTSNTANMVNTINHADGVITDPNENAYRTLRTESVNVMMSESNAEVYTQFPIYSVSKVMCGMLNPEATSQADTYLIEPVDITPYVFEAHEYNSVLSSYDKTYPYAKSYAIYYTQGQKNLKGLFFKPENATDNYFSKFAIANILNEATGQRQTDKVEDYYPYLCFNITYTPIYSSMFSHGKSHIQNGNHEFTTIYGQSENLIETTYYGENVKGVAQRLGNVQEVRTYVLPDISKVPKVGQKLGDLVISSVVFDVNHTHFQTTVEFVKGFNRISQYVGINSQKRISEVSEREAYSRDILIKEYVVVGDKQADSETTLVQDKTALIGAFTGYDTAKPITAAVCAGTPKKYFKSGSTEAVEYYNAVSLPVVSSAFGNAMVFSWTYKDNYSAGQRLQTVSNDNGKSNWQTDIPYCDYYGRLHWYDFALIRSLDVTDMLDFANGATAASGAFKYPDSGTFTDCPVRTSKYGSAHYPLLVRKDSREALNINYELEFVSNRKDLIIGSAVASKCTLVGTDPLKRNAKLYFWRDGVTFGQFPRSINEIDSAPTSIIDLGQSNIVTDEDGSTYIQLTLALTSDNYVPTWCIAYDPIESTEMYSDEDGEPKPITTKTDGEIVLACNKTPYVEGMEKIYISVSNTNLKGV